MAPTIKRNTIKRNWKLRPLRPPPAPMKPKQKSRIPPYHDGKVVRKLF